MYEEHVGRSSPESEQKRCLWKPTDSCGTAITFMSKSCHIIVLKSLFYCRFIVVSSLMMIYTGSRGEGRSWFPPFLISFTCLSLLGSFSFLHQSVLFLTLSSGWGPVWCPVTEWFIRFFASTHIWCGNMDRLIKNRQQSQSESGMLLQQAVVL